MVPNGWESKTFANLIKSGDVTQIQDGNHGNYHPKSSDFVPSGIPFIMARDLVNRSINLTSCSYITKKQADSLRIGFSLPGDILLSHKGTVGQVAIVPEVDDYIMLTPQVTYYRLPECSRLHNLYLYQYFRSNGFQERLKSLSAQSTRSYIGITAQKELSITLPPLPEQRKIAQILSTWDKAISTTEKLIETSKQQKKSLMQQILTGKKRLVNPATGKAFEGMWEEVRLGDICSKVTDGAHHSPKSVDYGYPMFSVKDMRSTGFSENTARHISEEDFEALVKQNCKPEINDILIAKDGSILKYCFVVEEEIQGVILSSIALLRLQLSIVSPHFIAQYFSQESVRFFVGKALTSGSGVPRIILKDFKSIQLHIPSVLEQQKIASVLTAADKEIEILDAKLANFKQEKKALMQQLLTGKRRVKIDKVEAA